MIVPDLAPRVRWWSRALWAITAAVVALSWAPPGHRAAAYTVAHLAMTALMLRAWVTLSRAPDRRSLDAVVRAGTVARVLLVAASPFTTTDVARYLWDGAVALHGRDPYALPPLAASLAGLRAAFPVPLDHLDVATCYPPLAVFSFALCAATGPHLALWSWKVLTALASIATVRVTWSALRGTDRAADVVLAAWSPLLMLEAGVGAHVDVFVALSVAVALSAARRDRWTLAALAGGLCAAFKLVPGIIVVPLVLRAPRPVWCAAVSLAPVALSFAVAEALGMTPPGSLPVVAESWSFAAPVWTALYARFPADDGAIRAGLAIVGLAGVALVSLPRRRLDDGARDVFGVHLLTSPVLYPWYGVPLASTAAFAPRRWVLALLAVLPVSYEVLDLYQRTGQWLPSRWPVGLIAVAFVAGFALDVAVASKARHGSIAPRRIE